MPTLAETITSVRRRVADVTAPQIYADTDYYDALLFAMGKLNLDWGQSFVLPPISPDSAVVNVTADGVDYWFLLVKLATIEMAYIRASEMPGGSAAGSFQTITVPDLNIQFMGKAPADVWMKLAEKLQAEYDGELEGGSSGSAGPVTGITLTRRSMRTGGHQPYELGTALDAVTLAASVASAVVSLSWGAVRSVYFAYYTVYRSTAADMAGKTTVTEIDDNHEETYDDEGLDVGTYYYQVGVTDMDVHESLSNIVQADVV
jgi:hypothetical protein